MWMYNGYGMGVGGWLLMAIFWFALIALIVFAIARLLPSQHHTPVTTSGERPAEILRRRLASGDIDPETYEQLSAELRDGGSGADR